MGIAREQPGPKRRSELEQERRQQLYAEAARVLEALAPCQQFSREQVARVLGLSCRQVSWAELQAVVKLLRWAKTVSFQQELVAVNAARPD